MFISPPPPDRSGNGTQQAFYDRDDVLFISVHQSSLYPINSGSIDECGKGSGKNVNINIPLPPGSGVGAYLKTFERIVIPCLKAFAPDLLLVSSGFDASYHDPLGTMMVTSTCFGELAFQLSEAMNHRNTVFCHEGGYSENLVPYCGLRVVEALAGVEKSNVVDVNDEEGYAYGYQDCQDHQLKVIEKSYEDVARHMIAKCRIINK